MTPGIVFRPRAGVKLSDNIPLTAEVVSTTETLPHRVGLGILIVCRVYNFEAELLGFSADSFTISNTNLSVFDVHAAVGNISLIARRPFPVLAATIPTRLVTSTKTSGVEFINEVFLLTLRASTMFTHY